MVSFRSILTCATLAFLPLSLAQSYRGTISKPAANTTVAPGAAFDFGYDISADYSRTTYNFSVYLFTELPSSFVPSGSFGMGHYFGRFDQANYPGVPYATHPAPHSFVMPDFSKNPGGFGAGKTASNVTVYLAVLEEYADGAGSLGLRMGLDMVPLIYNGTAA